jgi:biopolymer transport protein ExbD
VKLTRTFYFNPVLFTLVPMVNVLFLLAIFYGLSAQFVLQPGLSVGLPTSAFTLAPQQNPQIVSVVSEEAIYFQNEKVTMEEFAQRLADGAGRERSLIIRADRIARYDIIVQLMKTGLEQGLSVVLATAPEKQ